MGRHRDGNRFTPGVFFALVGIILLFLIIIPAIVVFLLAVVTIG